MNRDLFLVREVVNARRDREEMLRDAIDVDWHQRPLKHARVECGCEADLVVATDSWTEWEEWQWTKTCEEHREP
jgi:hypothetical protein